MVSNRQRRRALARAKWQRQQARRTAAQRRAHLLSIIGGSIAGVVAVVGVSWGGYLLVKHDNSPSSTIPTDNFPSLLQPSNPGVTVTSYSPGTPTKGPTTGPSTGKASSPTPTSPATTETSGTSSP